MSNLTTDIKERTRNLIDSFKNGEHIVYFEPAGTGVFNLDISEPVIIRGARMLDYIFEKIPVKIMDHELIVGIRPECQLPVYVTEEENNFAYSVWGARSNIFMGHTVIDYETVLKKGFYGIKEQAQKKLEVEKEKIKVDFLKSVIIICNAVKKYAERYSSEAGKISKSLNSTNAGNKQRLKELFNIKKLVEKVPYYPAQTFYEALQSVWFTHTLLRIAKQPTMGFGRFDQYMYPYYKNDIEKGIATIEGAIELLEAFFVKLSTTDFATSNFKDLNEEQNIINDQDNGQNLMLGGQDIKGMDSSNEFSYLCLDAAIKLKLPEPYIQVRVNKNTPDEFLLKACQLAKCGTGMPLFNNDEIITPSLISLGIPLHDARLYSNVGCNEILIPGKSEFEPIGVWIELLKCLELALNNGISFYRGDRDPFSTSVFLDNYGIEVMTGNSSGPPTGKPHEFFSFENLFNAFKRQVSYAINERIRKNNELLKGLAMIAPTPLLSAVLGGCVEKGLDKTCGGAVYYGCAVMGRGIPNVADSLAAIKTLVFDNKEMTLEELVNILKENYHKNEFLHERLLNEIPKFGNDDDLVDSIAVEVVDFFCSEVSKYEIEGPYKGKYIPSLWAPWFVNTGKQIGASADGRHSGEPISRNVQPEVGAPRSGPTAILNSVSKLNQLDAPGCVTLDLDLDASIFKGDEGLQLLLSLLKTYFEQGGQQLAFNLLDANILREAQKNPEKYKDLVVRVWGYSAYFVHLEKEHQDILINRLS